MKIKIDIEIPPEEIERFLFNPIMTDIMLKSMDLAKPKKESA